MSDPCNALTQFVPTSQTNLADDAFTGTELTFTLTPFTVARADCASRIVYSCTGVLGSEGDSPSLCTGFTDDGMGGATLSLTATEDNYFDSDLLPGTYTFTVTGTPPDA